MLFIDIGGPPSDEIITRNYMQNFNFFSYRYSAIKKTKKNNDKYTNFTIK